MRFGEKSLSAGEIDSKLLGVDFHDFIQREGNSNAVELASEFGLSLGEAYPLIKEEEGWLEIQFTSSLTGWVAGYLVTNNGETFQAVEIIDDWYKIKLSDGEFGYIAEWIVEETDPLDQQIASATNSAEFEDP